MTFKSLLVLGAMTMASSMAWAQGTTVTTVQEGRRYYIKAHFHSKTAEYLYDNGSKLTSSTTKPETGCEFVAEKVNSAGTQAAFKLGDKYLQWTSGDNTSKSNPTTGYSATYSETLNLMTLEPASTTGLQTGSFATYSSDDVSNYVQIKGMGTNNKSYYFVLRSVNNSGADNAFVAGEENNRFYDNNWNNGSTNQERTSFFEIIDIEGDAAPQTSPFEENAFYTLKAETAQRGYLTYNANAGTYEGPGLADVTLAGYTDRHPASTAAGVDTRWMLEDNEDGTVCIYNVGACKYLKAEGENVKWADEEDATAFTYTKVSDGVYNFKANGKYICAACGYYENAGALRMTSHEAACDFVVAATGGSYEEIWMDEEYALVSISAVGYSTLYSNVNLIVPFGYTAYTLEAAGEYLVATATSTIPANTGVVVAGSEGFTTFIAAEHYDSSVTSCLDGTVESNVTTPAGCCTLAEVEGELGFYHYTGATVAPYKAYYVAPAGGESNYRISFGELTSIISAAQQNGGQAIFDLQGRRVVNAKGINIVNGKKVIR